MRKQLTALATAVILGLAVNAQANQITGSIAFFGVPTVDNAANLAAATTITGFAVAPVVVLGTDDYAGVIGMTATFNTPIVFNPATPISPLWTVGGLTFNATTMTSQYSKTGNSEQWAITGFGDVTDGIDTTAGSYTFNVSRSGVALVFNSTATTVPDGGATLMLLGGALSAIGLIRRKLA